MKKLITIFAISALALTMTACGGNSGNKNTSTDAAAEAAAETNAPAAAPAAEGDVLAKYESLVDKAIELQAKVNSGDMAVVEEYNKLSQEMAGIATELSNEMANMSAEQVQRFQAIQQKLVNAATAAAQQ